MNISLSNELKAFVDARVKARGYSTHSEYVRDLVRRDEERAAEERFAAMIEEGFESGPAGEWQDLRGTFLADSGVEAPGADDAQRAA